LLSSTKAVQNSSTILHTVLLHHTRHSTLLYRTSGDIFQHLLCKCLGGWRNFVQKNTSSIQSAHHDSTNDRASTSSHSDDTI
jgi:hypothetical protein